VFDLIASQFVVYSSVTERVLSVCLSGVVLLELNELRSAEQVLREACSDGCCHIALQLAALDKLATCLLAQVICHSVLTLLDYHWPI